MKWWVAKGNPPYGFLDGSSVLRAAFGDGFIDSYLRVKRRDWDEHCAVLTDFERRATLDC